MYVHMLGAGRNPKDMEIALSEILTPHVLLLLPDKACSIRVKGNTLMKSYLFSFSSCICILLPLSWVKSD